MISLQEYFGPRWDTPEATKEMQANAIALLSLVNPFLVEAGQAGRYAWPCDPDTGTCISGSPPRATMSGDGGFRGKNSKTGTDTSKHRLAQAVDIFDPGDRLDNWITLFERPDGGNTLLERYKLYREHPSYTAGWCHLQSVPPGSGKRTFKPY